MTPKPIDVFFDNATIKAKRETKPHIVFIDGYWRVSPYQYARWSGLLTVNEQRDVHEAFMRAHSWVCAANCLPIEVRRNAGYK